MWPWEHALVGYLVYSLFCHGYYRERPGELEALVVAVASVLPDVVDKPLAWQFEVFQSGYALGHSIFFTVPLAVAAGAIARQYGRTRVGVAFAIGYSFHLVGDVVPIYLSAGVWTIRHLYWPVVVVEGTGHDGFVTGVRTNLIPYLETVLALEPTPALSIRAGALAGTMLLWHVDGRPGLRPFQTVMAASYAILERYGPLEPGSRN
ncbi:metal-dependent hydrolase [Natribaculum luteum]|uniref:Metal-dependent hydrolase n=1 Tax=Natribaculum luteum TaxID=1586232 RepID=A0ABD5NYJ9_9EURY|nr:metal-dependent hydrolase [Natribaculum luteum]